MKKRIAAMLLAAVMVFNIIGDNARPARAVAPAVAAAIPSFVAVVYGVMTGCFDECAEALGYCLQAAADGVEVTADFLGDCFVGDEDTPSWFVTGWCQITNTVTSWFDGGEIELSEDGKIYMNYYQYLELCNQMYEYMDITIDLGTDLDHGILPISFDSPIIATKMAKLPCYSEQSNYSSYGAMYYSDTKLYVTKDHFMRCYDWTAYGSKSIIQIMNVPRSWPEINDTTSPSWYFSEAGKTYFLQFMSGINPIIVEAACDEWFLYDSVSGTVSTVSNDQVDTTLQQGYLVCEGYITDFMDTVSQISAARNTSAIDDLSDPLDDVLVLNPNPGLVVDTDPSITDPRDAVLITDVPAVEDMTLTQAMEDTKPRLDMEVPSSIWNKFPFSLPFDFYRLLTIFAAEPKAPVFRIPISNVNVDMSAFEGNQTLGQFADGETTELMFEIDEEVVIDLSNIPYIQPISHAIFIVSFIALLIFITTKLIHH